ncbi:MAG: PH domain-containing protein [Elusimicrobiota bacterium]
MTPSELKLLVVSPSIKNWPILLGAGALVALTGVLGMVLLFLPLPKALGIAALGVGLTVWPAMRVSNTEYVVTNLRVVVIGGVFGKSETSVAISEVKEVRVAQRGMQSALGIGDLELVSQSGSLRLEGIEEPEKVREKILSLV